MDFLVRFLIVLQVFVGVLAIILVLLQNSKDEGNVVTGSANKGGTMGTSGEAKLVKWTKVLGAIYIILTIAAGSLMIVNQ